MTEVFDHNPGERDDPKVVPIWYLGLVGAVLLIVIVFGLTAIYSTVQAEAFQVQVINRTHREVAEVLRKQEAMLDGGTVEVEQQGQTVRKKTIPIERAMELVVEEARTGG